MHEDRQKTCTWWHLPAIYCSQPQLKAAHALRLHSPGAGISPFPAWLLHAYLPMIGFRSQPGQFHHKNHSHFPIYNPKPWELLEAMQCMIDRQPLSKWLLVWFSSQPNQASSFPTIDKLERTTSFKVLGEKTFLLLADYAEARSLEALMCWVTCYVSQSYSQSRWTHHRTKNPGISNQKYPCLVISLSSA